MLLMLLLSRVHDQPRNKALPLYIIQIAINIHGSLVKYGARFLVTSFLK